MVFLHVYGVIAKDRMKIGGFIPVLLDRIGTCICPIPKVPVAQGRARRVRGPQGRPIRGGRSGYGVGPQRPRQPVPPATRCALMLAAPSRAWHVCTPSVAEPWHVCTPAQPRSPTASSDGLGAKRLACGPPEPRGSVADRGRQGGQGKPLVARRDTASLSVRCAKGSVAHWGSPVHQVRHEGGSARHLLRTVPAMVRLTCSDNAARVVSALMRCGVPGLAEVERAGRGQALQGG